MANITINEVSQNYSYNVGNASYATVALPITSCWGPGFEDSSLLGTASVDALESVVWSRFPSSQAGLESFVSTFRGPTSQYLQHKDYSYQMAMTLLASGYDILACRVATGSQSQTNLPLVSVTAADPVKGTEVDAGTTQETTTYAAIMDEDPYEDSLIGYTATHVWATTEGASTGKEFPMTQVTTYTLVPLTIKAKYLGSFGNQLRVAFRKLESNSIQYWNCVVYIEATSGVRTAVENLNFVFDINNSTDNIPHVSELTSKFIEIVANTAPATDENIELAEHIFDVADSDNYPEINYLNYNNITGLFTTTLHNGSDLPADDSTVVEALNKAKTLAERRFAKSILGKDDEASIVDPSVTSVKYIAGETDASTGTVIVPGLNTLIANASNVTQVKAESIKFREWMFTSAYAVIETLSDKLAYNPNRIISPGWDDQDFRYLADDDSITVDITELSPLHVCLMDTAYVSRCATAYIDIPKSISRAYIYNEAQDDKDSGTYSGYAQRLSRHISTVYDLMSSSYATHSALFAPWGKFAYIGTTKQSIASPSFLALMIDRAMIKNQTSQYEWQLPTTRRHNLKIGKLDYSISKKYLDEWQSLEGVGINCITAIPDLGVTIWGNSTLLEIPPATYQALGNLSTRKLVNAVEDLAYRCGISITFNYNNDQAYNAFYAGMTPLLDTMRNVGAIEDYYLRMAEDVNGLDQVNANSVIGAIYLVIDGVINDITIDLIALPPQTSLDDYRA